MTNELAKMFLIKRLRKQRPSGECITIARLMDDAADEIERLTAEVKRLDHSTIHTCWDECPRVACAQRREIEALTAQLAEARQTERAAVVAWLRGRLIYQHLITAIEAGEHLTRADPVRDTLADSDGDDGA